MDSHWQALLVDMDSNWRALSVDTDSHWQALLVDIDSHWQALLVYMDSHWQELLCSLHGFSLVGTDFYRLSCVDQRSSVITLHVNDTAESKSAVY